MGEVTVAPVTTTIREIPSEIGLSPIDGVPRECAVNFDHIQTVAKGKIGSLITTLHGDKKNAIKEAISFALDL